MNSLHNQLVAKFNNPDPQGWVQSNVNGRNVLLRKGGEIVSHGKDEYRVIQGQTPTQFGGRTDFVLSERSYAIKNVYLKMTLGQLVGSGVNTNQVQRITVSALLTSGTYCLEFKGFKTAPLAYNANSAAIKAALESLGSMRTLDGLRNNNVVMTVSTDFATATSVDFTFGGALGNQLLGDKITFIRLTCNADESANFIQTVGSSSLGNTPANLPAFCRLNRAEALIDRIEIYSNSGANLIQTLHSEGLFAFDNMHIDAGDVDLLAKSLTPVSNNTSISQSIYLPIYNAFFNRVNGGVPLYLLNSDIRVTVYWKNVTDCLYTNYQNVTVTSCPINSELIIHIANENEEYKGQLTTISRKQPMLYRWLYGQKQVVSIPVYSSQVRQQLSSIVGPVSHMIVFLRVANATNNNIFENYWPVNTFEITNASGTSLSSYRQIEGRELELLQMREHVSGYTYLKGNSYDNPNESKAIYMYSFSNKPEQGLVMGIDKGAQMFHGNELLNLTFDPIPYNAELQVIFFTYSYLEINNGLLRRLD